MSTWLIKYIWVPHRGTVLNEISLQVRVRELPGEGLYEKLLKRFLDQWSSGGTLSVVCEWMASISKSWMPFLAFIWLHARVDKSWVHRLSCPDDPIYEIEGRCVEFLIILNPGSLSSEDFHLWACLMIVGALLKRVVGLQQCPNLPTQPMLILWLSKVLMNHVLQYYLKIFEKHDIEFSITAWFSRAMPLKQHKADSDYVCFLLVTLTSGYRFFEWSSRPFLPHPNLVFHPAT